MHARSSTRSSTNEGGSGSAGPLLAFLGIMVLMVKAMDGKYKCEVCGFLYKETKYAEECERYCREYSACNIKLMEFAVGRDEPEK